MQRHAVDIIFFLLYFPILHSMEFVKCYSSFFIPSIQPFKHETDDTLKCWYGNFTLAKQELYRTSELKPPQGTSPNYFTIQIKTKCIKSEWTDEKFELKLFVSINYTPEVTVWYQSHCLLRLLIGRWPTFVTEKYCVSFQTKRKKIEWYYLHCVE